MAKLYFEKLSKLVSDLDIQVAVGTEFEIKHFFSGAALYANKTICVTWSPEGLAFKLPESEVKKLLSSGEAVPLKYFEKGHIKEGYAMFEHPESLTKIP
jgi:TfoX/Sxy family transcriptional regulator of competence genes